MPADDVVPLDLAASLRWTTDHEPGITRRRAGRGFSYRDASGALIRDRATLDRIRRLAIPPAWTSVWISADPSTHLQATGRDARGRKQYRYHPAWRARREQAKVNRLVDFARRLPEIRARVDADLHRRGLPREKVLALVVRLLELTLIRVGNREYARTNRSFGLTTLRDRHARVQGSSIHFTFRGKGGRQHRVTLGSRRLARVVARCQELPGQDLLQYVDQDGAVRAVRSDDVNAYLREISGTEITAKDFRTWAGTVLAYRALRAAEPGDSERADRRAVVEAVGMAAERLGNTPSVARTSYIHPAVVEAFVERRLPAGPVPSTGPTAAAGSATSAASSGQADSGQSAASTGPKGAATSAAAAQLGEPGWAGGERVDDVMEAEAEVLALLREALDRDAARSSRRGRGSRAAGRRRGARDRGAPEVPRPR